MTKEKRPETNDGGLELDTLDGFTVPAVKPGKPVPRPEREPQPEPEKVRTRRKYRYIGPAVAVALLVLITILTFRFAKQDLSFSLQSGTRSGTSEHYLRVGPISATLPNSDIIKLSVDIGCRNDSEKKRLSEKDSLLRNQIVSVITAPETGTLFEEQRYDEIKAQIRKNLEKISEDPVGEIYFSELRIY